MYCRPVRAPGGIRRVPRPGLVHQATSSPSVSAMRELGLDGAQRQKSSSLLNTITRRTKDESLTINMVEEGRLAKGVLALGSRVAQIVAELGATQEVIGVGLVRLGRSKLVVRA